MRPEKLKTKIFLDSGNPEETKEILGLIGFLDGQTTNPSLVAKNPEILARKEKGERFGRDEIVEKYRSIVEEISALIPNGSVSIEVDASRDSTAISMFEQGRHMNSWIPNAHIKYPTISEGISAAEESVKDGIKVNMTLVFSQNQGAAVYSATMGANRGDVFVSPFIGRLDDRGENGLDFIRNMQKMYSDSDDHVEVLAASIRSLEHFLACLALKVDIVTVPFKVLKTWSESGMIVPDDDYVYQAGQALKKIDYQEIALDKPWIEYDVQDDLTDSGLSKFTSDWKSLIN